MDSLTVAVDVARGQGVEAQGPRGVGLGAGRLDTRPTSEIAEKAKRRRHTTAYKRRILRAADACTQPGEIGALLRREGLYSSLLSAWRQQRKVGALAGGAPRPRGPKAATENPLAPRVAELERENRGLQRQLAKVEVMLEIQKKASELLGIPLNRPGHGEPD